MSTPQSDFAPLYLHNPQERFSNRADDYAKYRPSYPPAAIDRMLQDLGQLDTLLAADIGAGTGISSRLLADRGVKVWAIEPNAAMRSAAISHPQVEFRVGTAEQTGLSDRSIDLITCFQAFHWFEPKATLQEFHRILKPGGRVALIWNDRDREDAFTGAYSQALRQAVDLRYWERIDRKTSEAEALRLSSLFDRYSTHTFINSHPLDQEGLVGIALSASYVPKTGAEHDQLIQDLQQLYDTWPDRLPDGRVALSYRTVLYLAHAKHPILENFG